MKVLYKTWFKATAVILCVLLLLSGILCGILLAADMLSPRGLLKAFQSVAMEHDMGLFREYFDPDIPEKLLEDNDHRVLNGKESNLLYEIIDSATGKRVAGTWNGEPVSNTEVQDMVYEVNVPSDQIQRVSGSQMIMIGSDVYAYDPEADVFVFQQVADKSSLKENVEELELDAYDHGFDYRAQHYTYDDYMNFYPAGRAGCVTEQREYSIRLYLTETMKYHDQYMDLSRMCGLIDTLMPLIAAVTGLGLLFGIVLLALLCVGAARREPGGEIFLSGLNKIPGDLVLVAVLTALVSVFAFLFEVTIQNEEDLVVFCILAGITVLMCVYTVVSFAARLKNHAVLRTTVCAWVLLKLRDWGLRLLKLLPMMWKVAACWAAISIGELFGLAVSDADGFLVFLWLLEKLVLTALLGYGTIMLLRLKQGAEAISAGDYDTPIDEKYMVLDLKDTADTLHHIQDGMNAAVESRMRSERMKTELITNVSHDIKTPLTAIVSYVDLLKGEPAGSEKAAEYIAVLDRQSMRLKRLTEDLVEASKAATGNVEVHREKLDAAMLAEQALGEYSTRLEQAGISVVFTRPNDDKGNRPLLVMADPRHLWRVVDNLLSNAVKYSMPGTRLYVTAEARDGMGTLTFRNISREPLSLTGEELQERFVRGDASRHSEGSGLGLSIAGSLTEAMGGTFRLRVDGDLFKAAIALPLAPVQAETEECSC